MEQPVFAKINTTYLAHLAYVKNFFLNLLLACIFPCVNCSSSTICLSCDTNNNFKDSGTTCICQDGYYLSGTSCICKNI